MKAAFSYRRATHRGEPTDGRQVSLIGASGLIASLTDSCVPRKSACEHYPQKAVGIADLCVYQPAPNRDLDGGSTRIACKLRRTGHYWIELTALSGNGSTLARQG